MRSQTGLAGFTAVLMCLSATFQVVAWIGGAPGWQAFYAMAAAWFAVSCWMSEKRIAQIEKEAAA